MRTANYVQYGTYTVNETEFSGALNPWTYVKEVFHSLNVHNNKSSIGRSFTKFFFMASLTLEETNYLCKLFILCLDV